MDRWSRRQFVQGVGVAGLGLVAGCGRLPGQAHPPPVQVRRVGNLSPGRQPSSNPVASAEAFEEGLRELGWVEGKNLAFERRYANGTADRLPDLAAELVDLKVDVIFTGAGLPAQRALKDIAGGIPIITVVSVQAPCATGRREGGGAAKPPPPVSYPAERLPPATP